MSTAVNQMPVDARRISTWRHRLIWPGLAAVVLSLAAAVASDPPGDESGEDAPLAVRQTKAAGPTIYGWVFGTRISDAVAARRQLDTILRQRIAVVVRVCGLTDAEKVKL